jgi:hypothetical protein
MLAGLFFSRSLRTKQLTRDAQECNNELDRAAEYYWNGDLQKVLSS